MKVYSTNCPKCIILLKKLNAMNVEYELIDDTDEVIAAAKKYGIKEAPFVVIDDKVYGFADAIKFTR